KSSAVGAEHGITPGELSDIESRVAAAHEKLAQERRDGIYGFYDLHKDKSTLEDVLATARDFGAREYENLVVLGIGGSALGTTALVTALKPPFYNALTKSGRKR